MTFTIIDMSVQKQQSFGELFSSRTPGEWTPWFERDDLGRITDASVDSMNGYLNLATTTVKYSYESNDYESLEADNQKVYFKSVETDTKLFALAYLLPETLDILAEISSDLSSVLKDRVGEILAKVHDRMR
jgi:hypothetical protein